MNDQKEFPSGIRFTDPNPKAPEWVIIPIVIAGFLGCYYAGAIAEWLINLQTILK